MYCFHLPAKNTWYCFKAKCTTFIFGRLSMSILVIPVWFVSWYLVSWPAWCLLQRPHCSALQRGWPGLWLVNSWNGGLWLAAGPVTNICKVTVVPTLGSSHPNTSNNQSGPGATWSPSKIFRHPFIQVLTGPMTQIQNGKSTFGLRTKILLATFDWKCSNVRWLNGDNWHICRKKSMTEETSKIHFNPFEIATQCFTTIWSFPPRNVW